MSFLSSNIGSLRSDRVGYPSTEITDQFRVISDFRSSCRARSDGFDPAKPKSARKSDRKYPNMTKRTGHDPEFYVDSKYVFKTMLGTRMRLSYSSRLKPRVKPLNSIFRPDPTEPNRYSNSPSNSDPVNPNLYPKYCPTARTRPNG